MDSTQPFKITTDYKSRTTPLSWETRLFAEVVFMDKTNESTASLLYQLKDNAICITELVKWKSNAISFPKESFVLIGEIASIDKKKKQIILINQNVVAYHYLVIASGSSPVVTVYGDEFTAGINALIDALRMKSKIPSSFANPTSPSQKLVSPSIQASQEINVEEQDEEIDKIVHPTIHSAGATGNCSELNSKRLFEVQL
jgi:NADH dehydrogenase FAD-containing subunit